MNGVQWGRALYRISKRLSLATALVNQRYAYLSPRLAPVETAMEAAYCIGAQLDLRSEGSDGKMHFTSCGDDCGGAVARPHLFLLSGRKRIPHSYSSLLRYSKVNLEMLSQNGYGKTLRVCC